VDVEVRERVTHSRCHTSVDSFGTPTGEVLTPL
jgi:hypothetical protein